MEIFKQLEENHSKDNSLQIIEYIDGDSGRFAELMDCFFMETKDYRIPQRAAHTVSLAFDKCPELVLPYIPKLINRLLSEKLSGALKRNILRILQFSEIDEKFRGNLYSRLFETLADPNEEIAVRAFAITVLYNITDYHKDLKP